MYRPASAIACLSLALACAAKPVSEPVASESVASEPVVFVEAPPYPAQTNSTHDFTASGPSEQDRERAKLLFQQGTELYEAGDITGAIERFEQAYLLMPLPALRFNIARGRQQLGDKLGACADYAELLADPDTDDHIREASLQEFIRLSC